MIHLYSVVCIVWGFISYLTLALCIVFLLLDTSELSKLRKQLKRVFDQSFDHFALFKFLFLINHVKKSLECKWKFFKICNIRPMTSK